MSKSEEGVGPYRISIALRSVTLQPGSIASMIGNSKNVCPVYPKVSDTTAVLFLCIHIIEVRLVIICWWWRRFLFQQSLPVQRAGRVQFQPRLYALKIEKVSRGRLAGQSHH